MRLALIAALILPIPALAHEATTVQGQPLGWKYGWECCSTTDCKPVADGDIEEGPNGYRVKATGEVVPYNDKRVKDSKDGTFHLCAQGGNFDTGRTLCIYRPPRGF